MECYHHRCKFCHVHLQSPLLISGFWLLLIFFSAIILPRNHVNRISMILLCPVYFTGCWNALILLVFKYFVPLYLNTVPCIPQLFIHFHVDGCLSCSQFWVGMKKATMNIHVQVFVWKDAFISLR